MKNRDGGGGRKEEEANEAEVEWHEKKRKGKNHDIRETKKRGK